MAKQVFVSNIAWKATEDDVRKLFEDGRCAVESVKILKGDDGRSRGFGFVTIGNGEKPEEVIDRMNGKPLMGREIVVALAKGSAR